MQSSFVQDVELVKIVDEPEPQLRPVVSAYMMVKEVGEPSTKSDSENRFCSHNRV